MLFNAKYIINKTWTLYEYIAQQDVDLACVTRTWTRVDDFVILKDLTAPGYSVLQVTWSSTNHEQKGGGMYVQYSPMSFSPLGHSPCQRFLVLTT